MVICGGLLTYIDEHHLPKWPATAITWLFLLSCFPAIIVQIKRWHDLNRSAFWIFINLIPVFGALWALIYCGFLKGTDGENEYGLDPLENALPPA